MSKSYLTIPPAIKAIQDKESTQVPLLAFHGSKPLRTFYLGRVKAHHKADEIISGQYWERGKGCAVGCSVHSSAHSAYETELGIPRILARLEDGIFEALYTFDTARAKAWPIDFLSAILIGADLSMIWPKFAHWLMGEVLVFAKSKRSKTAIQKVANLYQRWIDGDKPSTKEWNAAAAAYAASAADSAAYSAASAADSAAADSAAYSAATAAATAAYSAASAADSAARQKMRIAQADKLIELLKIAK